MSFAVDEYGRPFIIVKEQLKQKRSTGIEAIKSNILAAKSLHDMIKSSFGPRGMDKILVNKDGEVKITNDGAEILQSIEAHHEIAKLLAQLSKSQDDEIGDGTTGVVLLASALLSSALPLIEKGVHPLAISRGFDAACESAISHLEEISEESLSSLSDPKFTRKLVETAKTTLSSKLIKDNKQFWAQLAVDAIYKMMDSAEKTINLEMLQIESKTGSSGEKSTLIDGIILNKSLSHSQMKKSFANPKIALLTCPFEPPKPKTKHFVNVESVEQYKELYNLEQNYFREIVRKCKQSGADIVFCQWGFDDEANHLLLLEEMPAVRWVGGSEMEYLAISTGAKIVGRFEDLTPDKLGTAGSIKEDTYGSNSDRFLRIENCPNTKVVTVLIRGGNKMAIEETKRSFHDSLCTIRNLILDDRICYGGGSCELSCARHIERKQEEMKGVVRYGFEAFGKALQSIPLVLAENQGLDSVEEVSRVKGLQDEFGSPVYGVKDFDSETHDMKKEHIFESLASKRQQFQLATQAAKIILKTDDVISNDDLGLD